MAKSDELKKLYASNTAGDRILDTLELSHSLFSQTHYLVRDGIDHTLNVLGVAKSFKSWAFDFRLPEVGSEQQEMSIVFDNTALTLMEEVERASAYFPEPIKAVYRVYIESLEDEQSSAIELSLTNIVADSKTISAVASRPDLFSRYFPVGNNVNFDKRFKGLFL